MYSTEKLKGLEMSRDHYSSHYAAGFSAKCAEAGIAPDTLVKQAWIFSLPLGGLDTAASAVQLPYYGMHAATGPTEQDSTGRWKSLGLAGMAALSGLFGVEFAGMGLRGLGSKLGVLAARARGPARIAAMKPELKEMALKMDESAVFRHSRAGEKSMGTVGKYLGYASGGIAHPFNKLEDVITKGIHKAVGPGAAEGMGERLGAAGDKLMNLPGVQMSMSPWMMAPFIAGSMALQPDMTPDQQREMLAERYGRNARNLT